MATYNFVTPITDRTSDDVQYAMTARKALLLNPSNVNTQYKGCLNASDISRISMNNSALYELMMSLGYFPQGALKAPIVYTTSSYSTQNLAWKTNNITKILNDLSQLVSLMPIGSITLPVPPDMLMYDHVNNIETIQLQIYQLLQREQNSYRYSGTLESGSWWG